MCWWEVLTRSRAAGAGELARLVVIRWRVGSCRPPPSCRDTAWPLFAGADAVGDGAADFPFGAATTGVDQGQCGCVEGVFGCSQGENACADELPQRQCADEHGPPVPWWGGGDPPAFAGDGGLYVG